MTKIVKLLKDPVFWFIFITMMLAVPLGHSFTLTMQASIIWPAIGLGFALFVKYEKRAMIPLWLGLFVGYVIGLIWIIDLAIITALPQAVLRSTMALLALSLGVWLMKKFKLSGLVNLRNMMLFPVIALIVATVATTLGHLVLLAQGIISWDRLFASALIWFFGDFFSILIFTSSLLAALDYDNRRLYQTDILRKELLFYGFLLVFSILFFNHYIPFLNYDNHKFLYLPFAFVVAMVLPYRSFVIATVIFLIVMTIFPPHSIEFTNYFYYMFDVNIFLLLILLLIFLLKFMFFSLEDERQALDEATRRLARLITSMQELMTLSSRSTALDDDQKNAHASKVFKMIFNMFNLFDYGACLIVRNGEIQFIDAIGHDLDYLNEMKVDTKDWVHHLDAPKIYRGETHDFQAGIQDESIDETKMKPMKEILLMTVKLGSDFIIEMSFDVAKDSSKTIDDKVLQYFESINILLNSFYESEVLSLEQDAVKNSIISALLKVIALFDEATHAHSKTVGEIARSLGEAFELSGEHIQNLYWAGIVHDIGKIGVSGKIVNKQGVYSVLEYESMKKHVRLGYDLIAQSKNLMMIADLVLHHHERYDGRGYPNQVKGEDMALEKHILIISEAMGAMGHDWPHQKAKTKAEIIAELNKAKGSQFHPDVVEQALKLIEEGLLDKLKK